MKMDHIDERDLDQYILRPEGLAQAERGRIEEHLDSCNSCRKVRDYLRSIHEDLQRLDTPRPEKLNQFVNDLFPVARVIALKPFQYVPEPDEASRHYTGLLAAMAGGETGGRYRTVCTLASEEQQAIARIVRDQQDDLYRLYIHAEDSRKQRYAIVSVPGLQAEFVADERGRVDFRGEYAQIDWNNLSALLLTVASEYFLSNQQISRLQSGGEVAIGTLTVSLDDSLLTVKKQESMTEALTRVLINDNATSILARFDGKTASIHLPVIPATLTIRLYA